MRKTAVEGSRAIPVLLINYADTASLDRPIAQELQKQLFDGPSPTGTMTDYYTEISSGRFRVTGSVFEPRTLPKTRSHYAGVGGCYGICRKNFANLEDFVRTSLQLHDETVDFSKYDNDGPDGRANSGDDDGFVDFVAIVHPDLGGECRSAQSIWSHYYALDLLPTARNFQTNDGAIKGGKILIKDYVVGPAKSCEGKTTTIGVYCHEFGHAFGLPDLYDTEPNNGKSSGVGGWDLMGSGSMGGDGHSTPQTPSQMGAWSKEYLGWLRSTEVNQTVRNLRLRSSTRNPFAIRIDIDDDRAYLLEYRRRDGFDKSLAASGLLVWHVKNSVISLGMTTNRVNADAYDPGISVVEADDLDHLRSGSNRGDDGDVFPGTSRNSKFDKNSAPATARDAAVGNIALCNIREVGQSMIVDVRIGKEATCED